MRLIPFLSLFLIVIFNSRGQQLVQNNAETSVDFKIKNIGMYVNGTFTEATVSSNFNTKNLEESYINATINVNSINTKNTKRDKHLLKDDFFDVEKYTTIKLVSTKIEKVSENNYKLKAKLTIKKTTKSIVIPLEVVEDDRSITIKSNFSLNRRDYGVGGSSWVLSNTVKIRIIYIAKK
jgi:polyisoprenoid-binding protein YceI